MGVVDEQTLYVWVRWQWVVGEIDSKNVASPMFGHAWLCSESLTAHPEILLLKMIHNLRPHSPARCHLPQRHLIHRQEHMKMISIFIIILYLTY